MRQPPRIKTRAAVSVEGFDLEFRPFLATEIDAVGAQLEQEPENAARIAEDACRAACTGGDFDEAVSQYPLMCSEDILPELVRLGHEETQARVDKGARLWRTGDRNYGRLAPHLLAFQAYDGGDYTESEFAGALAQAELIGTVKGIYQLMQAYLKAQRR